MNFEWGSKLAERQDRVFAALPNPAIDDWVALKSNWLVPLIAWLCPCNLVIRHWCLLDLLANSDDHRSRIEKQMKLLIQPAGAWGGWWLEGYSYWGYTRSFLIAYKQAFGAAIIDARVQSVDEAFRETAYIHNGSMWPIPAGDLWAGEITDYCSAYAGRVKCPVRCKAVRFNLHTECVHRTYNIAGAVPIDERGVQFVFYTGYEHKYPTKWAEFKAVVWRFFVLVGQGQA